MSYYDDRNGQITANYTRMWREQGGTFREQLPRTNTPEGIATVHQCPYCPEASMHGYMPSGTWALPMCSKHIKRGFSDLAKGKHVVARTRHVNCHTGRWVD